MAIKEKVDNNSFVIPEGKKLKEMKIFCKKHGDITKCSSYFNYTTNTEGETSVHRAIFCIPCICEYLVKLQSQGELAELAAVPIIEDIEEMERTEENTGEQSEPETEKNSEKTE